MYNSLFDCLADMINAPQIFFPCLLMELFLAGLLIYEIWQIPEKKQHKKKHKPATNYNELMKVIEDKELIETLKKM